LRLIRGWSERKPMTLTNREGKLWITFYHQSKRYRKSLNLDDTKANRKLALNTIIPEIQYKLNSGEFFNTENENKVPTVGEYMPISFELHSSSRRELTQKGYDSVYIRHIKPYFEHQKLDAIKPFDVIRWQNTLFETLCAKRVKSIRTVLNSMFVDAINDEIIEKNPFVKVATIKKHQPKEKEPFSIQQMFSILREVTPKMKAFFAIGFFTGMRTGEIVALKWENIDFERRVIKVRSARRGGIESDPKTINSIRDVVIIDQLMPYLLKHKEMMQDVSDYLFINMYGEPFYSSSKISHTYWKPVLEKLELKYRKMYLMRHTFISLMISHGEDLLWISKNVGHKDLSITFKEYARYIDDGNKKRATFLIDPN